MFYVICFISYVIYNTLYILHYVYSTRTMCIKGSGGALCLRRYAAQSTYYYVLLRNDTTDYYVLLLTTMYYYLLLLTTTTYYYYLILLLATANYYLPPLLTTIHYYLLLLTTTSYYLLLLGAPREGAALMTTGLTERTPCKIPSKSFSTLCDFSLERIRIVVFTSDFLSFKRRQ